MKKEKSCGAVIYRLWKNEPLYLLVRYKIDQNYWGLTKGHMETGEEELDTARREIYEETSIQDLTFIDGFREVISYYPSYNVFKEVVFFLAQTSEIEVKSLCDEHDEFSWLSFQNALERMSYEKDKSILIKAHQRIAKN